MKYLDCRKAARTERSRCDDAAGTAARLDVMRRENT